MKKTMNRRGFLKNSLLAGGGAAALPSLEEKVLAAETKAGKPGEGFAVPAADPLQLPKGKINAGMAEHALAAVAEKGRPRPWML